MSHNSPMSKRTSNAHTAGHNSNHSNQNATASPHSNNANNISTNDKRTQSLNALPPQTLIHLLQIKEEERKRAKSLLKNALVQLEVEVDRGEVLAGRVKELEENVEREKAEKEKGGSLDVNPLKEMLAEQRGRVSGGAEVEGLKLKLNNTERELSVFRTRSFSPSLINFITADNALKKIIERFKLRETIPIVRSSEHER